MSMNIRGITIPQFGLIFNKNRGTRNLLMSVELPFHDFGWSMTKS